MFPFFLYAFLPHSSCSRNKAADRRDQSPLGHGASHVYVVAVDDEGTVDEDAYGATDDYDDGNGDDHDYDAA